MARYILHRLGRSALTILGVMMITFLLFRVGAGDIAGANIGQRATVRQKTEWRHKHKYDLPWIVNLHRRLLIVDSTGGNRSLMVEDPEGSNVANALALIVPGSGQSGERSGPARLPNTLVGKYCWFLSESTALEDLTAGRPLVDPPPRPAPAAPTPETAPASQPQTRKSPTTTPAAETAPASQPQTRKSPTTTPAAEDEAKREPVVVFRLGDGDKIRVNIEGVRTCGELMDRINQHPANAGRLTAKVSDRGIGSIFDSQFFHHLAGSVTFQSRSFRDNRKLTEIIAEHAGASLSITVPSLAIGWVIGMVISCFVAYYRGSTVDKLGVFLCVLGMCIPTLAYMIFGQWLMFQTAPPHAYGTYYRANVYVPIFIMVIAGLGGSVRFYRTVILDETNRDYVRTARAKGVPLPDILFKHVLRNCMLPILTNLIMAIPFLILGSLLFERYFGIPGLGDLMLTSIQDRNEPILSGMVFLTTLIYTVGILVTDLSYAVFDPRIRLR